MKKKVVLMLLGIFIFFNVANLFMLGLLNEQRNFVTGEVTVGTLALFIEGGDKNVYLYTPENITYDFSVGETYTLNLNSSDDFNVETWTYTLEDLRHDTTPYSNVVFSPNTTFNAVRWQNRLTIFGEDASSNSANQSVVFYVSVPNSAPIIENLESDIYVCEGSYLSYYFDGTDVDEDVLTSDISPKNPFYIFPISTPSEDSTLLELISGTLGKTQVGGIDNGWKIYGEEVSVSDGEYSDSQNVNINVIEINNPPVVSVVGVQTVQTKGDDSTFYEKVSATDTEDGNQDIGNLGFNISILNSTGEEVTLFDISNVGVMSFTPNSSQVGVYNITLCVNDTGIENPFEGIVGNCSQDGGPTGVCQDFGLTVTDANRAPTITDYYSDNLSLYVSGTDALNFNLTEYDPDGTYPDAYWFVDDIVEEYDSGSLIDEFSHSFGCGISGEHTIKAEITDGLENDSVEWAISVTLDECPVSSESGGGGGGTSISPNWACEDWGTCQDSEKSLEVGLLSGEDYRIIKEGCSKEKFWEEDCGFQTRGCVDLKNLTTSTFNPPMLQSCLFVVNPSCFDFVKNCHGGACEFLVDCGGPCPSCPTCSDEIKNQGEEGIDCGGPCPVTCPAKEEKGEIPWMLVGLISLATILSGAVIIILIKVIKLRRRLRG